MSNPINGTPVNFGFGAGAGATVLSGVTDISATLLLQNAEHGSAGDSEVVRDGAGAEVSHAWHNETDSGTLEWVVTGANLAATITNTVMTYLTPGLFLTITCTNMTSLNASVWEVQPGVRITGSNTTSKRISVPIRRVPGVTAVATPS